MKGVTLTTTSANDLRIINFPHPTLRHVSKPLRRVDADLKAIVRHMFDLMYEANGIGLAANQVDLPLRLFVINLQARGEPSEEMVFINPVLSHPKGNEEMEEGCLSLPGLFATLVRPKQIRVHAYNLVGEEILADLDGMLGRAIQHETDHLDGVLFIDRLSETKRLEIADAIDEFEIEFRSRRATGGIPDDAAIAARLAQWERRYC